MTDAALAAPAAPRRWAVAAGRFFVVSMLLCLGGLVLPSILMVLPHISGHYGVHLQVAETLYDLPMLAIAAGAPLGGFLADRFGYRITLLLSLLVYSLGSLAGPMSDAFMLLLASRLVLGLAAGAMMAVALALVGAWYVGLARSTVLGFALAASAAVSALLLAVAGALSQAFMWRLPFLMFLALGLVTLAIAWMAVRGAFHGGQGLDAPAASAAFRRLWPICLVALLLAVGAFISAGEAWGLLKEGEITGVSAQDVIFTAGVAIAPILGALAYSLACRWAGDRILLVLAAALMGGGVAAMVLQQTPPVLAADIFILQLGAGLLTPVAASIVLARAPEALRATAAGFLFGCFFLGRFLAPFATGMLDPQFEALTVLGIVGGVLLAVAGFAWAAGVGKAQPLQGVAR